MAAQAWPGNSGGGSTVAPLRQPPRADFVPRLRRVLLRSGLTLGVMWLGVQILWVFAGPNFHTVVPGVCYRSAQPTSGQLERFVRLHGIRTVVNLRGQNPGQPWFQEEVAAAKRLGVKLLNVPMSSHQRPDEMMFRQLLRTLDGAERPILLHCFQGADRTGMAAACFLLLYTDQSPDEAARQLSVRYGHFALGKPALLDHIFCEYSTWLITENRDHSSVAFRAWVNGVYSRETWQPEDQMYGTCAYFDHPKSTGL